MNQLSCRSGVMPSTSNIETDSNPEASAIMSLDDKSLLKEQLQLLQCPFNWAYEDRKTAATHDNIIKHSLDKLEEMKEDGTFSWRTFNMNILLCYELYCKNSHAEAIEKLKFSEQVITKQDSTGIYDEFFQATEDALHHVIASSKCHIHFATGCLSEVEHLLKSVKTYADMNSACKAAIWGIRASVCMEYGYEGNKNAVQYLEKAIEFEPHQGEWHFMLGKCLGRIRRMEYVQIIPTETELKALEKAVEITRNPYYVIFLAQSYREAACRVFSEHKNNMDHKLRETLYHMSQRSHELYREALELKGDCACINIRCAEGFSKLPQEFRDEELAKECCDKALILAPNNAMAMHVKGNVCEWFDKDIENAKKYYRAAGECGVYGASMQLCRLQYKEDKTYDPIPDLENLLKRYKEKVRREDLLSQLGSYYYFIKNNVYVAYNKYWKQIIDEDPESIKLKSHKCTFICMKTPVNIYELLYDEARLALNGDAPLAEDMEVFEEMKSLIEEKFPEMLHTAPFSRRQITWNEHTSFVCGSLRSQQEDGKGREEHRDRKRSRSSRDCNMSGNGSQSHEGGIGDRRDNRRNLFVEPNRYKNCDSSTEKTSSNDGWYPSRAGSRDSSVSSRDGHYSKERHFQKIWWQRDSGSQDKNWRSGPRNFAAAEGGKPSASHDSSYNRIGGRSEYQGNADYWRTDITTTSGRRTDNITNVGSDVRKDLRKGCLEREREKSSSNTEANNNWRTVGASSQKGGQLCKTDLLGDNTERPNRNWEKGEEKDADYVSGNAHTKNRRLGKVIQCTSTQSE